MAYFTKAWYENMQDAHVLVLPESDEEWADFIRSFEEEGEDVQTYLRHELEQMKGRLLHVLPEEFHPFIEDGSINQPSLAKEVKVRLLAWIKGKQQEYEAVSEQAHVHFESIRNQLPEGFVNLQGLHDASILHVVRKEDAIRITLDGTGSFTNANRIVLTFQRVKEEQSELPLQEGQYWLYEEVDVHEVGAVFRVLVDGPMTQWAVVAEDVIIEYYYKATSVAIWQDEETIFGATAKEVEQTETSVGVSFPGKYKELLMEQNGGYLTHNLIVTAQAVVDVGRLFSSEELIDEGELLWISQNVALDYSGGLEPTVIYKEIGQIAENVEQFLEACLSTEYVDEMEIFSVPLSDEELEPAVLGDNLELMVRAWNTMYEQPEKHVPLIEKGLLFLLVQEDENLLNMGSTFAFLFEEKGIFTEVFKERLESFEND